MNREEKILLHAVLVYPVRGDEILLALKTKKIGAGCWNGYGGGIEAGETPEICAVRELEEESGLKADITALEKIALIDFHNQTSEGKKFTCRVYVYLVHAWDGEVQETEEMQTPTWFPISALPLSEMMPADQEWLPKALTTKRVKGEAWYGPHQKELLQPMKIESVEAW